MPGLKSTVICCRLCGTVDPPGENQHGIGFGGLEGGHRRQADRGAAAGKNLEVGQSAARRHKIRRGFGMIGSAFEVGKNTFSPSTLGETGAFSSIVRKGEQGIIDEI